MNWHDRVNGPSSIEVEHRPNLLEGRGEEKEEAPVSSAAYIQFVFEEALLACSGRSL